MSERSVADRMLGLIGGAMVLAALFLLVFGGEGDGAGAGEAVAAVPALALRSPEDGATAGAPLELRFETAEEITSRPSGWGTESLHLHLRLDGREFMPGPADLRRDPAGGYVWTVPGVGEGEHTVQLYWSDLQHRPMRAGATPAIRVRVE